ncbi:GNAT family N-acetyltransferase [Actinoplanes siamensis]|uniref:GCN5 family N-acetyltransferase n=1 Tax=Actinoplanes siamensis TaxID=1223317 RepID=A0A919TKJ5_9ACTN|nr:GNAT family N-acetyltransferase [Actinoplanes siamensis]GIF05393.1 GCN5 family N-acetyltransferase [Actinoplanes siamensis]
MIRPARESDIPAMRRIEVDAGRLFLAVEMGPVARDEPLPTAELLEYQRDGRAWVVAGAGDGPVAYAIAKRVDGLAHLEQVSVHPAHAGQRLGADLIGTVAAWGRQWGAPALTLTTFAEVPWNAPYYRRLGFRPVPDAEVTPGLRAIRAEEAAHGLDRWPRLVMSRAL